MAEKINALNLGCGGDYRESTDEIRWVNLDNGNCKVDVCEDIESLGHRYFYVEHYDCMKDVVAQSIPDSEEYCFRANVFDRIDAIQVLEHISKENFPKVIRELYRISKNGGVINVAVPHGLSENFVTDFTHKMPFSHRTMDYFIDGTDLRENGVIYGYGDVHLEHAEPVSIDGVQSLHFYLRVVKP